MPPPPPPAPPFAPCLIRQYSKISCHDLYDASPTIITASCTSAGVLCLCCCALLLWRRRRAVRRRKELDSKNGPAGNVAATHDAPPAALPNGWQQHQDSDGEHVPLLYCSFCPPPSPAGPISHAFGRTPAERFHAPAAGNAYFFNSFTKTTSWTRPMPTNERSSAARNRSASAVMIEGDACPPMGAQSPLPAALPDGWAEHADNETGCRYWWHAPSRTSVWVPPRAAEGGR